MHDEPPQVTEPIHAVVAELIDEHFDFDCNLVQVDAQTWAITGSIAVDGEVILAEFSSRNEAEVALEQLAAAATKRAANLLRRRFGS